MWKRLFRNKKEEPVTIPVTKLGVLLQPMNPPKPIGFDVFDENNKLIGTLEYKEAIRALMEYENHLKQYLNRSIG